MKHWHHRHRHWHARHHHRWRHPHSLQRRLFIGFGATIVFTALVVGGMMRMLAPFGTWERQQQGLTRFVGDRLAAEWDRPDERDAFVRGLHDDLSFDATLRDAHSQVLFHAGEICTESWMTIPVARGGHRVGTLEVCGHSPMSMQGWWRPALALFVALCILWGASGMIARRLLRPLRSLKEMAKRIGEGDLKARSGVCMPRDGELGILGETMDDMASRIEKQLADQRELLAAVSHELRTPLGHLRVLLEMARDAPNPKLLDEMEKESLEIDALVGQLLASSRLDFGTLEHTKVEPVELAARAIERAGLPSSKLEVSGRVPSIQGDPTLLARALANLIANAQQHGQGLLRMMVEMREGAVRFAIEDEGPGIPEAERAQVFEAFYRGEHRAGGSLGLGLSLVQRIAQAHDGEVRVEAREGGGARVVMSIALN